MAKQTIGEFLATLRKANGYTQQEIANRLGISNRTLSGWECDNVLPDILLLPALADIYGVTVDEILAGERKERKDVALTTKSEKHILKSKIARFTMQSYILVGIIIVGIALAAFCAFVTATSSPIFLWLVVLLSVGAVAVIICMSILFACWKGAELSIDDATDNYGLYCLILRRKLANCLYILSAAGVLATVGTLIGLFVYIETHNAFEVQSFLTANVIVCVSFGAFTIALFVAAWLLCKHALTKFGGEAAHQSIQRDRQHFWAVGFWGMIPLVLSVILAIVLTVVHPFEKTVVYQNSSADEFVEYMESIATPNGYRSLPLSELAKTARLEEEIDLGDGYFAVYHRYSFTVYNEMIEWHLDGSSSDIENVTFSIEVPRIYMSGDDDFSFFNARYYWLETGNPFHFWFVGDNTDLSLTPPSRDGDRFVRYDIYAFERVGEGMEYYHEVGFDFSLIGYAVSFPVIAVDLIVCASLCVARRNKFSVKL